LHKETEWEARERVGEKPFNKTEKAVKEERKRKSNEDIEDTIERYVVSSVNYLNSI